MIDKKLPNIKINEIITDTKRIYAPYSIFDFCVKQEARKIGLLEIKKGT